MQKTLPQSLLKMPRTDQHRNDSAGDVCQQRDAPGSRLSQQQGAGGPNGAGKTTSFYMIVGLVGRRRPAG